LDVAQRLLVLVQRAVLVLAASALAVVVGAVWLAGDRARAAYLVGLAVAATTVLVLVAVRRVADVVPDATSTPGGEAVATALADSLRVGLERSLLVAAGARPPWPSPAGTGTPCSRGPAGDPRWRRSWSSPSPSPQWCGSAPAGR